MPDTSTTTPRWDREDRIPDALERFLDVYRDDDGLLRDIESRAVAYTTRELGLLD
jgi:hypothetical protein